MNSVVTFDYDEAETELEQRKAAEAVEVQSELDQIFRNKITSPEEVYAAHAKLELYEFLTGNKYEINFEENTIV